MTLSRISLMIALGNIAIIVQIQLRPTITSVITPPQVGVIHSCITTYYINF
jgi:hypothetical protein